MIRPLQEKRLLEAFGCIGFGRRVKKRHKTGNKAQGGCEGQRGSSQRQLEALAVMRVGCADFYYMSPRQIIPQMALEEKIFQYSLVYQKLRTLRSWRNTGRGSILANR
jgi:hypothetical protein